MKDQNETETELITELIELGKRISELEAEVNQQKVCGGDTTRVPKSHREFRRYDRCCRSGLQLPTRKQCFPQISRHG